MKNAPGPYTTEPSLLLFRRRLAALMRVTGVGQDELAATIGQSPRSIALWLTGVRLPSAVSLKALSRTFGVPADWLLARTRSRYLGAHEARGDRPAPKIAGADKASD